jgi:hypothetical protein
MPKLKNILVIHTTDNQDDRAGSAADFSLEISKPGADVTLRFEKKPGERQRGRLDVYQFPVSQHNVDSDAAGFSLIMTIKGDRSDDGWLPRAIFVLGQTVDDELTVLGDHPFWDAWFDGGPSPEPGSKPAHEISSRPPEFEGG